MTVSSRMPRTMRAQPYPKSGAVAFQNVSFAAGNLDCADCVHRQGGLDPVVHVTNGPAKITANATANPFNEHSAPRRLRARFVPATYQHRRDGPARHAGVTAATDRRRSTGARWLA